MIGYTTSPPSLVFINTVSPPPPSPHAISYLSISYQINSKWPCKRHSGAALSRMISAAGNPPPTHAVVPPSIDPPLISYISPSPCSAIASANHALEELPLQMLSGPQSDLTCIASASAPRKRPREDLLPAMDPLPPLPANAFPAAAPFADGINAQMQRLLASRATSTSGRSFAPSLPNHLLADLHTFTLEIDTLLRIQVHI